MGSPIKLEDFIGVFGPNKLGAEQLTPAQSRTIGNAIIDNCKPQLKYLRGSLPFGEYLRRETAEGTSRGDRLPDCEWHDVGGDARRVFDGRTKVFPVMVLYSKMRVEHVVKNRAKRLVHRKEILLSMEGDLFVWDWHAELKLAREHQIASRVQRLEGRALAEMLGKQKVSLAILQLLKGLLDETIDERRKRLSSMEDLKSFIDNLNGKFNKG